MPACFQLTPKGATEPATLHSVDEALCKHYNAPVDEVRWFSDWFNVIGFRLAYGDSFTDVINMLDRWYDDEKATPADKEYYAHLQGVCTWLEAHYSVNSWHEVGRRA